MICALRARICYALVIEARVEEQRHYARYRVARRVLRGGTKSSATMPPMLMPRYGAFGATYVYATGMLFHAADVVAIHAPSMMLARVIC